MTRERQLENALATLVDLYVCNLGTEHEFITCITPPHASNMSYFERRRSEVWAAFDNAREVLGGNYTIQS